jgi:hypothetical protein
MLCISLQGALTAWSRERLVLQVYICCMYIVVVYDDSVGQKVMRACDERKQFHLEE